MSIVKINNKILVFILFILIMNVSCEKKTEYNVLSGQLVGNVSMHDSTNIYNTVKDNSGVEVIVEGSNPQIKTFTDEDGYFSIDNLKSGTYNFIFNKEGYCQHKIVSYQFVGGNKPTSLNRVSLYWIPTMQIDSIMVTAESNYSIYFLTVAANVSHQPENANYYYRYYLSNKAEVSYKDYLSTDFIYGYHSTTLYFQIMGDTIKFPAGSKLYMIMYPASESYQYYTDITTGKKIYTSININKPSDTVSITVPEIKKPW